jgi:antirestriction protein ArdC
MQSNQILDQITNDVIKALETGTAPWVKPWDAAGAGAPYNPVSGTRYKGINFLYLSLMQDWKGGGNAWLTYKQAQQLGGQVRKGSKGTHIVYYKPLLIRDKVTGDETKIPMLKSYVVFNANDVDGVNFERPVLTEIERLAQCEQFIADSKAKIKFGGDSACYIPMLDIINMPQAETFKSTADYYATMFHELGHWTGHESRLNRFKQGFAEDLTGARAEYAFEELVAELSSAMLCSEYQVNGQLQHASYIASWLKALRNDKKFIFKASAQAQKVYDWFHNVNEVDESEE